MTSQLRHCLRQRSVLLNFTVSAALDCQGRSLLSLLSEVGESFKVWNSNHCLSCDACKKDLAWALFILEEVLNQNGVLHSTFALFWLLGHFYGPLKVWKRLSLNLIADESHFLFLAKLFVLGKSSEVIGQILVWEALDYSIYRFEIHLVELCCKWLWLQVLLLSFCPFCAQYLNCPSSAHTLLYWSNRRYLTTTEFLRARFIKSRKFRPRF